MRVVRGGSYIHPAKEIRCSQRNRFYPAARDPYIGFRIVRHD
jgi:formylglycine-generating enzyme required for sulfatase activity